VLALWQRVFDGQMVDQVVYRLIAKDGTVKWVAGSWGAVTDEAGHRVGIRGTCQDITERVATERLLEETTQKFRTIVEEIAERKRAEQALRQSEHTLAMELDAAQHLQHVATQLIETPGTEALYEQVLDAAMAILHSDLASIQMFHPDCGTNGELRLLGHRGFNAEATKRWEWVRPTTRTICGEALRTGRRVVVPDV